MPLPEIDERRRRSRYSLGVSNSCLCLLTSLAPIMKQRMCQYIAKKEEIAQFKKAIDNNYVYELFVDGLPVKEKVGEKVERPEKFGDHYHNYTRYFLYTHLAFSLSYHTEPPHTGGHVIGCNISATTDQMIELVEKDDVSIFCVDFLIVKVDHRMLLLCQMESNGNHVWTATCGIQEDAGN